MIKVSKKIGRYETMNEQISLCHNLLEKMKNIIAKIVGKASARQSKFYLDLVYGILKAKALFLILSLIY